MPSRFSISALGSKEADWDWQVSDEDEAATGADIGVALRSWCLSGPLQRSSEALQILDRQNLLTALATYSAHVQEIVKGQWKLTLVERLLGEVRARLSRLEERQTVLVPIETLDPEPFRLERPVTIVVEPIGEEFVATYFDAGVSASGETVQDAVENLKEVLLSTFEFLESERNLGTALQRQKKILDGLLRRI